MLYYFTAFPPKIQKIRPHIHVEAAGPADANTDQANGMPKYVTENLSQFFTLNIG